MKLIPLGAEPMLFWVSSRAVLKINYSEGTEGEGLGWHFSGYSSPKGHKCHSNNNAIWFHYIAAAGKRVTRPKAKAFIL
ncbi:MAG: hypothetical protein A6F71_05220 [Cycloclasticus sp. symbiont of Poecilosclerida sp. M]|nr:MAG: hypothetical protein A6F71_05220 [Cycloclasticus sp. symbiont of Poecilosclerida sp. M]